MRKFLLAISFLWLLLTLLPLIPLQYGWIRIWSYPRLQLAVLMIITLIGWAFIRSYAKKQLVLIGLLLVAACYQLSKFIPYTPIWKPQVVATEKHDEQQRLSILFYNVLQFNKNTQALIDLARSNNPDILLLAETDEYWRSNMHPFYALYPYKVEVPQSNTYGMCLYSKLPLSGAEIKYLVEPDIPSIHTYVQLRSGQRVKMYCIHPEPPDLKKSTSDRDAELVLVAKEIGKKKEPVIVAGDLNDVAWSSTTTLFTKLSKCNDPRVGRGLYNTFNAKYPLFRWPLDHFFLSTHFKLNQIDRLPKIGSDHFPMFISVTFNPASMDENKQQQADEEDMEAASKKLKNEKAEDKE
ncbi:endonuclease/exonuclease/phosphatase family protein [Aridibaculum aurantiacum]|uniref:endonuclease/exonuclease/phosphatase family protein n=1 Tax=Aridibaculum aurantiacum TaxID=2810307 RepID=UPI001A96090C|nr:endonuclease/exonuclease/phosphatase family protein [Aridibaculum aurantiacum]